MSKQPEALRLAEWIEDDMTCQGDDEIAAELRRLHGVNTDLLEALQGLIALCHEAGFPCDKAEEVVNKATGEQQ
jgi:hypothetical protein